MAQRRRKASTAVIEYLDNERKDWESRPASLRKRHIYEDMIVLKADVEGNHIAGKVTMKPYIGTLEKPAVAPHGARCTYPRDEGGYCGRPALWLVLGWEYCDEHVGVAPFDADQYAEYLEEAQVE